MSCYYVVSYACMQVFSFLKEKKKDLGEKVDWFEYHSAIKCRYKIDVWTVTQAHRPLHDDFDRKAAWVVVNFKKSNHKSWYDSLS